MEPTNFFKLGGRKFLLAVGVLIAGIVLELLAPKGLTDTMATLFIGVVAGFGVTNAAADYAARGEQTTGFEYRITTPDELPVEDLRLEGLETRLKSLEGAAESFGQAVDELGKLVVELAKRKAV